ncbi:hypothetical protein D047_0758B, partial [Vibrio parahaemolyticus VPTS-2010_2]
SPRGTAKLNRLSMRSNNRSEGFSSMPIVRSP